MTLNTLAITITSGLIAVVTLVCVTVLLVSGVSVPAEFYALLGTSAGGAGLGAAVATGAAIAKTG